MSGDESDKDPVDLYDLGYGYGYDRGYSDAEYYYTPNEQSDKYDTDAGTDNDYEEIGDTRKPAHKWMLENVRQCLP